MCLPLRLPSGPVSVAALVQGFSFIVLGVFSATLHKMFVCFSLFLICIDSALLQCCCLDFLAVLMFHLMHLFHLLSAGSAASFFFLLHLTFMDPCIMIQFLQK